ncbi:MAG: hypothetical protein JJE48_06070, partial [Actinobacteria bacterium]|nr:hypothetical protein [Actinomycetota bacterium]
MLYNRSLQTAVNIVVIVLLVGSAIILAVGFIPSHSPLAPLIGKMSGDPKGTSAMLNSLDDPKAVGRAIEDNPEFLVEVMKYSDPKGTAIAVNENPEWLADMLSYVDGEVVAGALNKNEEFLTAAMSNG